MNILFLPRKKRKQNFSGFTLVELMIVTSIIAILASIAIPTFSSYLNKARNITATGDIQTIGKDILAYQITNDHFPDDLSQVDNGSVMDPWGNPYQYLNIEDFSGKGKKGEKGKKGKKGKGKSREDRFKVPINSDFDLYSMGKDGKSKKSLTSKTGRDDIVRANNGSYVGPAWKY